MTVQWHTGQRSRASPPMGRVPLSLPRRLSPTKFTTLIFLSISLPLISLLSSLVPCYPINSLPQCFSSLVLIIKLDVLQVVGGKTSSLCRHQTDNALQLTFVFSITCGLGNVRRMVDVTLPHMRVHTHIRVCVERKQSIN